MKKKYEDIGKRLRVIRGNVPQNQFAPLLKTTLRAYQYYEQGEQKAPFPVLVSAAEIGKTSVDWILTGKEPGVRERAASLEFLEVERVPVFSLVGAGNPQELWESEPIDYIFIPKTKFKPGISALRIAGTSMEPTLKDGASVFVDKNVLDLLEGRIYIIYLKDNGIVLKRIFRGPGIYILKSDNPIFPDVVVTPDQIDIQGRVVGVYQEL